MIKSMIDNKSQRNIFPLMKDRNFFDHLYLRNEFYKLYTILYLNPLILR